MSIRRTSKYFTASSEPTCKSVQSPTQPVHIDPNKIVIKEEPLTENGTTKVLSATINNDSNNNIRSTIISQKNYTSVKKAFSDSGDECNVITTQNKKLKTRDQLDGLLTPKTESNSKTSPSVKKIKSENDNQNTINAITDATLLCYEKPRMLTRLAKKLMEQANAPEVAANIKTQTRAVSSSPITASKTVPGGRAGSNATPKASQATPTTAPTNGVTVQKSVARKSMPKALPSTGAGANSSAKQTKGQTKARSSTVRAKGRPKKEVIFPEASSPSASSSNGISLSSLGSGGASAMPAEFSTPEYVRERLEMVPFQAPKDWQKVLANTKQMRFNAGNAPVDDFGPMRWMLQSVNSDELDDFQLNLCRFRVIVCLILSIRGRDKTVNSVMEALGGENITPQSILAMSHSALVEKIRPVGLQETKANYLRQTSRLIIEKYNMVIPNNMEDLYALPGIDNKCGVLALHIGFNKDCGIAVDTHVHRIANRLGWANSNNPSKTMMQLQDWVPREEWGNLNHLLVGFGQLICTPKNPSCQNCLNNTVCPFGRERLRNLDF